MLEESSQFSNRKAGHRYDNPMYNNEIVLINQALV